MERIWQRKGKRTSVIVNIQKRKIPLANYSLKKLE